MNRTTVWRSVAVLGAASLALAACGGGSSGGAGSSTAASASSSIPVNKGPLVIGSVLPQTGSLAFLGPPEFAGVQLAVNEINAAGGVLGQPVQNIPGDSGDTSTNIASQTVDRLLSQKADVIIGAASSSVTLTIIDKITSAGVLEISPANTSIKLSTYPDHGLYWRTAPPDTFQGAVLGNLVAKDGNATAGVLALQDAYGEGLAKTFSEKFTAAGGTVTKQIIYDPKAPDFSAEVSQIKATNPDAVVLIGFDESKKILQELIKQGIGPDKKKLYLVDGNLSNTLAAGLPMGIMKGVKGTTPGAEAPAAFRQQLLSVDPKLTDFSYAAESYDAVILAALAADAAKNVDGRAIATKLVDVSKGGVTCTTYKDCLALLNAGKDINYDGVSGPVDFYDNGDPSKATMGIYEFGANNKYAPVAIQYVTGDVPPATG